MHRRLPAGHGAGSLDRARRIIRLHRRRWITGLLFRTIGTQGLGTGRVSMATAPLRNPRSMALVAGVSCLQSVQDRNGGGKGPLGDVFSPTGREALEAVSGYPWGQGRETEEPASRGITGLCNLGLCASWRVEPLSWKTRTGRHAAGTVPIPSHPAWTFISRTDRFPPRAVPVKGTLVLHLAEKIVEGSRGGFGTVPRPAVTLNWTGTVITVPGSFGKGFVPFLRQLQRKSALVKIVVPVHVSSHRECSFLIFKNVVAMFLTLPRKGLIMHVSVPWGRKKRGIIYLNRF